MIIKINDMGLGIASFPDRVKPQIVKVDGNTMYVLGSLKNKECAKDFEDRL